MFFSDNGQINIRKIVSLAIVFLFFLLAGKVYAGGWIQEAGSGLFIKNTSYFSDSNFFDNYGNKKSLNGLYRKYEVNPYLEYGLRDWLTIGGSIYLQRVIKNDSISATTQSNYGVGDSEIFARTRLWHDDNFSFAVEPMVKFPSLTNSYSQPMIGNKNFATGLTLSAGYDFIAFGQSHFVNLDVGYKKRFGNSNNQLKYAASAGFSVSPSWVLMPQIFITSRYKNKAYPIFTQSSGDDYSLTQLQFSALYKVNKKLAVQTGFFYNVAGKNIGNGKGIIFAVHRGF
jgi:hypothetical protein